MPGQTQDNLKIEIARRVRGNVIYAALGGALLIYFGWFAGAWNWDVETWSGRGVWLIMVAMRAGGILMALAALFCMTGMSAALLLDSMTTLAVGVSLTLGARLFFQAGGTNALLYLVLGLFLSNSGYRSWQEYRMLNALTAPRVHAAGPGPFATIARPATTLSNRLTPTEPQLAPPHDIPPAGSPAPNPPPEGYLAAFGRDDSDPQK